MNFTTGMFLKNTLIEKVVKVDDNGKDITCYSRKCDFVTITISEEENQ